MECIEAEKGSDSPVFLLKSLLAKDRDLLLRSLVQAVKGPHPFVVDSKKQSFREYLRRISILGIAVFAVGIPRGWGSAQTNTGAGNVAGIAAQEVVKRQNQVTAAQTLFAAGSQALAEKSYGEAMDNFKAAFETMPPVPAVEAQRRAFFKRYQSAALAFTEVKISEARWNEVTQTLEEVVRVADDNQMPASLLDPRVKSTLEDLANRDDRFNQAMTPQHLARVNEVESKLILANGYLELGDYDRAERSYHQVLNVDKTNTAARRGLEKVERFRMNYYDAARDHTRAKMLREVAEGWETPVPPVSTGADLVDGLPDLNREGRVAIEQKLEMIRIPQIELIDASLKDVLDFLVLKSQELDTLSTNPADRGVNIVIDAGMGANGEDPGSRIISMRLTNVPLSAALKYATQQAGVKYRIDNFAVSIVPLSDASSAELITRSYSVPPGFISSDAPAGGAAGPADPFANPEPANRGIAIKRVTAKEFLTDSGILFGEGASARFVSSTSTLVVRNTPEQLLAIENLIQSTRESGGKMVEIRIKLLSVSEASLNQIGMDWLLGGFNLGGGTPRIFGGGGTDGNTANVALPADFPFQYPGGAGPIGLNPLTAGLRIGDIRDGASIDDLINAGVNRNVNTRAPGVFSVAGVFTDPQFQMVLRAVSQLRGTDFMDESYVVAKPGQRARIERIREFIYPTEYDPPEIPNNIGSNAIGEFIATPATPTAFEMREVGSVIEVEPTVSADNQTVNVNIVADFTDFAGFINYGTPLVNPVLTFFAGLFPNILTADSYNVTDNRILMPVFDSVKETTNVTVWDGQTIAIGGFHGEDILQVQDKVPGIGDLPIVGSAFRSRTNETTRRAILLFVTVNLVDPSGMPINAPVEDPDLSYRNDPVPPRPGVGGAGVAPAALPAATYPAK